MLAECQEPSSRCSCQLSPPSPFSIPANFSSPSPFSTHANFLSPSPFSSLPPALFTSAQTVKLSGICSEALAESILSHNPQRITSLAIDHVKFHRARDEIVGWASVVKSALPTVISLVFRTPGTFSADDALDAAQERRAFKELAAVLESLRQTIRHVHVGTSVSPECGLYIAEEIPGSQKNFEDLVLPTWVV